jgi:hypothetical protein
VFQHSRTGFYLLLRHSAVKERTDSERFVSVSLECPLTHKRLEVRVCWWSQSRVDILLLVGLIKICQAPSLINMLGLLYSHPVSIYVQDPVSVVPKNASRVATDPEPMDEDDRR